MVQNRSKTILACNGMTIADAMRASKISALDLFGIKSDLYRKKEFEASVLMAEHFNGDVNNMGFKELPDMKYVVCKN